MTSEVPSTLESTLPATGSGERNAPLGLGAVLLLVGVVFAARSAVAPRRRS